MTDTHVAPRLARLDAIETGAAAFFTFARRQSVRFDLGEKVRTSIDFAADAGGSTFAIPTKLQGTSRHQASLAALGAVPHLYRKLVARFVPDTRAGKSGEYRLALYFGGDLLGFLQDKHIGWMEALIPSRDFLGTGVQFYALAVTGGEPGRPTRGLNLVITGAGERAALRLESADSYRVEADAEAEIERQAEEAAMMDAAEHGHELF